MQFKLRTVFFVVSFCALALAGLLHPTGFLFVVMLLLTIVAILTLAVSAVRSSKRRLPRLAVAITAAGVTIVLLGSEFYPGTGSIASLIWSDLSQGQAWFHFSGAVFSGIQCLIKAWLAAMLVYIATVYIDRPWTFRQAKHP
jgi:hypothetical protein